MAQDASTTGAATDCEAMGSVDTGDVDRFIVAYPCEDDTWVSVPLSEAATLPEWR